MLAVRSVLLVASVLVAAVPAAFAANAQVFQPPASSPLSTSTNYTGPSNNTLTNSPLVPGKSFDRFIQIWFENTDYNTAASSPVFQSLATQGLLMTSFYAVTHPSQPNYQAVVGGDFFGTSVDDFRAIPSNISTVVDLLEAKNISWSSYQESMPYDGYTGYNYTSSDYITGNGSYTYYVRKHNPLIIYDSVSNVTERALRIRNFNDFATDVNASALPQWMFITPNLVNDGHDTTITFMAQWIQYWLVPLLSDERFNNNRTLILLTFDETETYTINNQIWTLALGGALPASLRNTTDDTFYTHYSALSTVEANWGLDTLGRGDANATLNNVFAWVAAAVGWTNNALTGASAASFPLLNLTGTIPGPLNPALYVPFAAPNMSARAPGGGGVFAAPGLDPALTAAALPAPVNLTARGEALPWGVDPGYDYPNGVKTFAPTVSGARRVAVRGPAALALALGVVVWLARWREGRARDKTGQ
ncbi:phosphoesterase family-domain-containing protein [Amylocystis lapponica]|nr:phosphoesterase family-domain-containing protein [Amylocystis lapponica]